MEIQIRGTFEVLLGGSVFLGQSLSFSEHLFPNQELTVLCTLGLVKRTLCLAWSRFSDL